MNIIKIDQLENIRVADSFVKYNKVGIGSGEARLYVGSLSHTKMFFDELHQPTEKNCFILRQDLLNYLRDSEFEYKNPSDLYKNLSDLPDNHIRYTRQAYDLQKIEFFTIEFALDQNPKSRCYIRATDKGNKSIYTFLREILLPEISMIDIIKVIFEDQVKYWIIPKIEIQYNRYNQLSNISKIEESIKKDIDIKDTEKLALIKSRIGQGDFRDKLIDEMVACPITLVDDKRLLVASHIKPWAESDNFERLDHFNGLLLTPTFDKLFDQGLITFENPNKILLSNFLSNSTVKKLRLNEYTPSIPHFAERKKYLDYHRTSIFKSF